MFNTLNKIIIGLLLIIIIASGAYNVKQHFSITSLTDTNSRQQTDIDKLTSDNILANYKLAECQSKVEDQSAKIIDAQKKTKEYQKQLDDLGKLLEKRTNAYQSIIDNLRKQPSPKTCEETKDYLKDNIGSLLW